MDSHIIFLQIDPENAILWSHLGEATRNPEYFLKSWEMSEHRLAAPMRGLGELYLEKEKFAEACEAFDNALKLNPVFGANWFSMGWAAIKTQQWDRASMCYTRNVQMDNEDGHSWSNLATCYLQMGDAKLVQAYHCLIQAKKWSAKSWRIWDNLFTVAVELGERLTAAQVLFFPPPFFFTFFPSTPQAEGSPPADKRCVPPSFTFGTSY